MSELEENPALEVVKDETGDDEDFSSLDSNNDYDEEGTSIDTDFDVDEYLYDDEPSYKTSTSNYSVMMRNMIAKVFTEGQSFMNI